MKWPNHSDYSEAIQNPELCFEVPELHTGVVATTPLGLPRALSGNFATVYEMSGGGQTFAVRCFVRQVTNQQERYAVLAKHLDKLELPFVVPFEFISKGIRVQEQWYPIVKMNWVTGTPFHDYVESQLASPEHLAWLASDWRSMMSELKRHQIGHGDLQHGNILVNAEGDLRLVDYDGMFVPAFARQRSPELGHANYQHPKRTSEFYDEQLDHFPEILIYLSLRALAAEPALWNEYFNGDNLIVTAVDLRVPQCSTLWPRLLKSPDHDVRRLTVLIIDYLRVPPAAIPSLETVLDAHLAQTVVPAQLQFGTDSAADDEASVSSHDDDTAIIVEACASRAAGPIPANRPKNRAAHPQSPPRLIDVFGWSALVTALLALVPPLHIVAGLSSTVLAILSWLMPAKRWQPARVAAAFSLVLALTCAGVGNKLRVAARLQNDGAPVPLETRLVQARPAIVSGQPMESVSKPDGHSVVLRPLADSQNSSPRPAARSLLAPTQPHLAHVAFRWRPHTETVSAMAITTDQRHLVSAATDRSLAAWNLNQHTKAFIRKNLAEPVIALTALTNLGIVTTADAMHQVQWWSLDGAVPLKSSNLDPDSLLPPTISPNGQVIALGGENPRQIELVFNTTPATRQLISGLTSWAKFVRFSADSKTMAVVCHDDSVSLREVASAIPRHAVTFADAAISDAELLKEGKGLVAIGESGAMRIWNMVDGSVLANRQLNLKEPVMAHLTGQHEDQFVVASNRRVLIVSAKDNLKTQDEIETDTPVTVVTALADGKGFATGHKSGAIEVWQFDQASPNRTMQMARP